MGPRLLVQQVKVEIEVYSLKVRDIDMESSELVLEVCLSFIKKSYCLSFFSSSFSLRRRTFTTINTVSLRVMPGLIFFRALNVRQSNKSIISVRFFTKISYCLQDGNRCV